MVKSDRTSAVRPGHPFEPSVLDALVRIRVARHPGRVIFVLPFAAIRRELEPDQTSARTVQDRVDVSSRSSDQDNALGLLTFPAIDDLDAHPLARVEGGDAAAAQCGDMDKHILAAAIG